jgi:transcriptional regulator with XRE-family HTH domain
MSQSEAAEKFGVSLTRYQRWETGKEKPDKKYNIELKGKELSPAERCFIARRRQGLTLAEVSEQVGYCKMWVNRMELGQLDPKPLLQFYGRAAS